MLSRRIAVTGLGMISAIGRDVQQHLLSLKNGNSGISTLENFFTRYSGSRPVGEIKITNSELEEELNPGESGVTRTSLLALKACKEAIASSGLNDDQISSEDTAIINANTVGGMCLTDEMYADSLANKPSSPFISSYSFAATTVFLQHYFKSRGIVDTINTACSSSANAIIFGARLMKAGKAKRAIVGGSDALARFTINGFNALHILSSAPCRPFDSKRTGLNLGEAGAFLVLEWEDDAKDKEIFGYLSGYANTNDSYHASALSDEGKGPTLSMQRAIASAGIASKDIDYINAHGTATENNDLVESVSMKNIFSEVPPFNSTKGLTGHTLGAAGALEAGISLLSLNEQAIFPGVNFESPIPETMLVPTTVYTPANLNYIMSNSFGFGGNCSSLIFSTS